MKTLKITAYNYTDAEIAQDWMGTQSVARKSARPAVRMRVQSNRFWVALLVGALVGTVAGVVIALVR